MESRGEILGARLVGLVHHLHQRAQVAGPPHPRQEVERVGDQDAAGRRRRVREDVALVVGRLRRLAVDHCVVGQVLPGDQAAALQHPVADRRGDVAVIREPRALPAEASQQVGHGR